MKTELTIKAIKDIDVSKLSKEELLVHIKRLECVIGHLQSDIKRV